MPSAMGFNMSTLRKQLQGLLANRHSPEAKALYLKLARYIHHRVRSVAQYAASDLLSSTELDEIVADILLQLMTASLAQFRGDSIAELMGFVRTITDRYMWRMIRKRIAEKRFLQETLADVVQSTVPVGSSHPPVDWVPDNPLSPQDEAYLRGLLAAGSMAEYARQKQVSRAAVTQRIARIRKRVRTQHPKNPLALDAWLAYAAKQCLEGTMRA